MPAERLSMRQIREVLRLCFESRLPQRAVARSLGLGQGTVSGYLSRARATGIAWPLPEDLDVRAVAITDDRSQSPAVFGIQKDTDGLGHPPRFARFGPTVNPMFASVH